MSEMTDFVESVVREYKGRVGFLIPIMQDIQAEYGFLPREALDHVAQRLDVPLSQIYSVATFYTSFRLAPKGKHVITLCLGTVCYLKGARAINDRLQETLGIEAGQTTADGLFTYQPVNCLGMCALAPVLLIDEKHYSKVKPEQVSEILAEYAEQEQTA